MNPIYGIYLCIFTGPAFEFINIYQFPGIFLSIFVIWFLLVKPPNFINLAEGSRVVWTIILVFLLFKLRINLANNGGLPIVGLSFLVLWLTLKPPKFISKPRLLNLLITIIIVGLATYNAIIYSVTEPFYPIKPTYIDHIDRPVYGLFVMLVCSILMLLQTSSFYFFRTPCHTHFLKN